VKSSFCFQKRFAFSFTPSERTKVAFTAAVTGRDARHPAGLLRTAVRSGGIRPINTDRPSCSFVAGYGRRMVKIYNPTFLNVKCEMRRFEKYERSIRGKRLNLIPQALDIWTLVAQSPAPVDK
jgi:hypothetical protein